MIAAAAIVTLLAAEALSVYALNELFAAGFEEPQATHALLLVLVAMVAFGLPRLIAWWELEGRTAQALAAVVSFVVLYGSMRLSFSGDLALWDFRWAADFLRDSERSAQTGGPAMLGSIAIIAAWVLASRRASDEIELERIPKYVGFHFALVTVVLVLSVYTDREGVVVRGGAAFYAVAVVALACSQLAQSGATYGDLRAGGTAAALLGATLAATLVGVLVFGVAFAVLGPHVGPPLGKALETAAYVVLFPPAWLLDKLFSLFLGGDPLNLTTELSPFAEGGGRLPRDDDPSAVERASEFGLRTLGLILVVLAIGAAVSLYLRFRRPARPRRPDDSYSVAAGSVQEDLRGFMRGLFRRGHGGGGGPAGERSAMERLYAEVLADAASRGARRIDAQTADEFVPVLRSVVHSEVADEITAAFDQARYAGREPDARRVSELRQRWEQARR